MIVSIIFYMLYNYLYILYYYYLYCIFEIIYFISLLISHRSLIELIIENCCKRKIDLSR